MRGEAEQDETFFMYTINQIRTRVRYFHDVHVAKVVFLLPNVLEVQATNPFGYNDLDVVAKLDRVKITKHVFVFLEYF